MKINLANFGLAIESPLAVPGALNFRPLSWPPKPDWPVMIDKDGNIVSRYGDSIWRLDPWAKKAECINFSDGRVRKGSETIDIPNADLLRQIVAWWIWGPKGVRTTGALTAKFTQLRPLFSLCSKNGILASDLIRFPAVAEQIAGELGPSYGSSALTLLHELYEQREFLGFTLLDRGALTYLEAKIPGHEHKQTAYIPPRIWMYQVNRLRECLDDFHAHRNQIESCFKFCVAAYLENYGSLEAASGGVDRTNRIPFSKPKGYAHQLGYKFHGPFMLTAKRFGIDKLLLRWLGSVERTEQEFRVSSLTSYFSLVSGAGLAYLMNFSLMRVSEGMSLRANCLDVENDPRFGDIYILSGVTTKTTQDDDARWPTSPSAKVAIDAMAFIARLQLICATSHSEAKLTARDKKDPYLINRCAAPWTPTSPNYSGFQPSKQAYCDLSIRFPKLFDLDTLRITEADLQVARLITPTLDAKMYAVGEVWPLAWHQLRRTGAVNMQASGLISDASLQYLLKHATRAMSLYYGQGYSRLRLNDAARTIYVQAMYEVLGKELARLLTDRFVSPHGEKRKVEIVRLIKPSEVKELTKLAKKGHIGCREVLLGYCMKKEPCPYGGIDSVAHCGGGDSKAPCAEVLYDKAKAPKVKALDRILDERLANAPHGSPLQESLLAQKKSVKNYQHVIQTN
ncbi:hypothetical protein [Polaromonas sp. LjRoot131]|uniref:hypothetical protein n=1 Tax=Polaromonas sp. LjRoot131 TaxID=3342262 RepID=UPI003ECC47B1